MPYRFLSNSLHLTADRAVTYFKKYHGAKQFKFEELLSPDIDYRPTIQALMSGTTGLRNESGHKPKNRADLIKRDSQLRTRFESAADLLLELCDAVKQLHV